MEDRVWCKCKRLLLTLGQMQKGEKCYICQREAKQRHAEEFHEKYDIDKEEKEEKKWNG